MVSVQPIAIIKTLQKTTVHVVMDPSGGGCNKSSTSGLILDPFSVENIMVWGFISRLGAYSSVIGLVARPIATMRTLQTTLHVTLRDRFLTCFPVKSIMASGSFSHWEVFKPNRSRFATYGNNKNTPKNNRTCCHGSEWRWL